MKILLIGGGGREHALAWKLSQSAQVSHLFVAPGNAGTADQERTENIPIGPHQGARLCDFALANQVTLTVVGPETPLVHGIVDAFQAAGLAIFGPTQAAAQLEGSKAFAKEFMEKYAIPTGASESFTDFDCAMRHLRGLDEAPVIKASGLAAGKGVIVPDTLEEAAIAVRQMLLERRFGAAGETILVEERLSGPELSVLALCDGRTARLMPAAQDYKRLQDGDRGPNTGGMGAVAPSPVASPDLMNQILREIVEPTLAGIAAEGAPYAGVLYAGLMLTEEGPKVIEFNCRWGDPETQALIPLLHSDLVQIFQACVTGHLDQVQPAWMEGSAATVVMAAQGYPAAKYLKGVEITGIKAAEAQGCLVFQAGTKRADDGRLVSDGGRVLAVSATGLTLTQAVARAYDGVACIHFNEAEYRRDIGGSPGLKSRAAAP